jgi:hypothetical protein
MGDGLSGMNFHESKLMIDIICRRIPDEMPGTVIATIHFFLVLVKGSRGDAH